ncbi:GNAT family N-acetyltransferase [Reyranella sp. CPCC 100927]|uniref:GNAT family N-acetyltransferase n=1 Tax=Reyranella sp. CPCC 100927 TaxID=2599616 RepID=UPI002107C2B5|nr:N-acetyltransferase [Reyranella sp. CPCC 100927]
MVELAQKPMRIVRERRSDAAVIEAMVSAAFGPDRMQKTVYKLREGVRPLRDLSFVALDDKRKLVASLRFWPILINGRWPAVLLGPLAVAPELRGLGYGKALMWHGLARCRVLGISRVILVGDPEYYNPFGFRRELALHLQLPGWVEERRFLALETIAGAMIGVHGMIGPATLAPLKLEPKKPPAKKRDRARDQARKARAKGKLRKRRAVKRKG